MQKKAAANQRRAAIELSNDIRESIELKLRGNREYILLLAEERAQGLLTEESFPTRVSPFLNVHTEFINIKWVDAEYVIRSVSPQEANRRILGLHVALSEPTRASRLARETRAAVYTRPFESIRSSSAFELWVPVYKGDTFMGFFSGVYSCKNLLERSLSYTGPGEYAISLSDSAGATLAAFPKNVSALDGPVSRVPLDPPVYGVEVTVVLSGSEAVGGGAIVFMITCALLLMGLVFALWKVNKESRLREETEMTLRDEKDRLEKSIADRVMVNEKLREAQEQLKFALDGTNDGIWDVWLKTGDVYLSPRGCEILGYRPDELAAVVHAWKDLVHPDDLAETNERLTAHLEGREPLFTVEQRLRMKSGEWKWILTRGKVVGRDEHGTPLRITGTHTDIADRKRIEETLAESEEKYRTLIDASADAIFIDHGRIITYLNRAAVQLFGADRPEDIIGRPPLELFHPDYHAMILRRIQDVLENRPVPIVEEKIVRLDGGVVEVEVAATSFAYRGKRAIQVVLRDITQRKKLEQQLVQSQKLEGLGTLAGGIAHDFNNLLSAMMGNAELLKEYVARDERSVKYLDRIIEAAERGGSIAKQLLLFSRQSNINLQTISVSHIIQEVTTMLRHFIPKTVSVTSDIEADNGMINGDAGHIHQIILNLCLNAKDAIDENGRITIRERTVDASVVREKFSAAVEGKFVAIAVIDDGSGIDESILPKIFDPFFTTKVKGKGTGLGLSIVDSLVRSHNGYLEVESKKGEGTTFTVYLPAVPYRRDDSQPAAALISLTGKRILVADDEQDIRLALVEYLESLGAEVLVAADGVEALAVFERSEKKIDLIITDLGMPKMTGESLVRNLQKIDPSVRVIVSSGYLDRVTRSELIQRGIVEVLTKPYKFMDIQKALSKIFDIQQHTSTT
jgi:PAS domain S-box-containing protein